MQRENRRSDRNNDQRQWQRKQHSDRRSHIADVGAGFDRVADEHTYESGIENPARVVIFDDASNSPLVRSLL